MWFQHFGLSRDAAAARPEKAQHRQEVSSIVAQVLGRGATLVLAAVPLVGCGGDRPAGQPGKLGFPEVHDDIPMQHVLQSNDWETLDALYGFNMPNRHVTITVP